MWKTQFDTTLLLHSAAGLCETVTCCGESIDASGTRDVSLPSSLNKFTIIDEFLSHSDWRHCFFEETKHHYDIPEQICTPPQPSKLYIKVSIILLYGEVKGQQD